MDLKMLLKRRDYELGQPVVVNRKAICLQKTIKVIIGLTILLNIAYLGYCIALIAKNHNRICNVEAAAGGGHVASGNENLTSCLEKMALFKALLRKEQPQPEKETLNRDTLLFQLHREIIAKGCFDYLVLAGKRDEVKQTDSVSTASTAAESSSLSMTVQNGANLLQKRSDLEMDDGEQEIWEVRPLATVLTSTVTKEKLEWDTSELSIEELKGELRKQLERIWGPLWERYQLMKQAEVMGGAPGGKVSDSSDEQVALNAVASSDGPGGEVESVLQKIST